MFTSAANGALTVSANGSIMVTATGNPTPSFTETGALPMGVTFTDNHNGTATVAGTPAASTVGMTYTLNITAQNGVGTLATLTFTLNIVAAPSITSFTAAKTTMTAGGSTTLTATFTGGTGSVNNGVGTVTSGTQATVSPSATTTYTLTVTNTANTSVTQQVTVTVVPAPAITSFTAGAAVITSGTSTMLTAVFTGGTGTVDNGVGTVTSGTHATVTPTTTTTYTLTVTNAANASVIQTVTVTVVPPPVISSFIASPPTLDVVGSSSTLTPVFSNGTGVITNNVDSTTISATSGTGAQVTPSVTTTYTLSVSNSATTPATVTATAQVTVLTKPVFTSPNNATFTVGANGTFTVTTTTNSPVTSVSITSGTLPNNLNFTDNHNGTATIAGAPAANTNGTYTLTITAVNAVGLTNQSFTLTVNTAPVFTSVASTTFTVGTSGSFPVTASGTPAPSITESGTLPLNVSFNPATGILSGVPQPRTGNTYSVTFTASNGVGTPAVQNFVLTVDEAPMITSMNSFAMTVGTQSSFQVMTSGFPHPSISDGGATLPTGVAFTDNGDGTASLSGQPASGSQPTYTFTITASNGVGTNATQSFTLTVSPPAPIMISPSSSSLPNGTAGTNYSQAVTATGGIGPYTFALDPTSAALPANLMLTSSASPNQGVISGTPTTAGTTTGIIVDVTDSESPAVTQKMTYSLTINSADPCATAGSGSESLLSGPYVFTQTGFDNGATPEPALLGGILIFNGTNNSGQLMAGSLLDMNLNAGFDTANSGNALSVTGTYKVGSDHRACMILTTTAGTFHYRVSLAGISGSPAVASTGHMINFDTTGPFTAGTMYKQSSPIPTSLSGSKFAFGISSPQNTANSNHGISGGNFAAAGAINFTSGAAFTMSVDFNQDGFTDGSSTAGTGFPANPISITGGVYGISGNGRGTFTFTPPGTGSTVVNAIMYVVSPSKVLILDADSQANNSVFAGTALAQSGSLGQGSLNGKSVIYFSSLGNSGSTATTATTIGTVSANGAGSFTVFFWQNQAGTIACGPGTAPNCAATGGYTVASSGRVTLSGVGNKAPIFWVVGNNEAFFLGADDTVNSGMLEPQTSTAAPNTTYAFATVDPEGPNASDNEGVATFTSGTGAITGTSDDNSSGSQQAGGTISSTFTTDSTGLVTSPSGCTIGTGTTLCKMIFYVISPTRAVGTSVKSTDTSPSLFLADQ